MNIPFNRVRAKRSEWPVFISYRRSDATWRVALWLKEQLEREPIQSTTGKSLCLDVFVDVAEGHRPDFQAHLIPYLQHSRVLIVLADRGAALKKTDVPVDFLYEELEWWAMKRVKTPPIILQFDPQSGQDLVSHPPFEKWRNVSRIDCFVEKWSKEADGGKTENDRLLKMLRDNIRDYGRVIDLDEVRRLRRWTMIASVFAGAALLAAVLALLQTKQAHTQSLAAKDATRQANRQLAQLNWQMGQQARGTPVLAEVSLTETVHHLFKAALAAENASDAHLAQDAMLSGQITGRPIVATFVHSGAVKGVSISPDGTCAVSWSDDGTARLWEATSGASRGAVLKHDGSVTAVIFRQDGKRILSWSADTAYLWNPIDGEQAGEPMTLDALVRSVASPDDMIGPPRKSVASRRFVEGACFSSNGRQVLTWGGDRDTGGELRLWDAEDGKPIGVPMHHGGRIYSAIFSASGRRIISFSEDGTARLWNSENGYPVGPPVRLSEEIRGTAQFADGDSIVTWGDPGGIVMGDAGAARLWKATDTGLSQRALAVEEPVLARRHATAAYFIDATHILTWGEGETLLWDDSHTNGLTAIKLSSSFIRGASAALGGQHLLVWSDLQANIYVLRGTNYSHRGTISFERHPSAMAFSADAGRILSWGRDGAQIWSADSLQPVPQLMTHEKGLSGATISTDGARVITWSNDRTARLWRPAANSSLDQAINTANDRANTANRAVANADGSRILSRGTTARLWNAATFKEIPLPLSFYSTFNTDGSRILSWKPVPLSKGPDQSSTQYSDREQVSLWNAQTGTRVGQSINIEGVIRGASFSRDGSRVVAWSTGQGPIEGEVRVWESSTGQQVGEPIKRGFEPFDATLTPNGRHVVVSNPHNASATLWDPTTGMSIGRPADEVFSWANQAVIFSPDGNQILAWARDRPRLWNCNTGEMEPVRRGPSTHTRMDWGEFSRDGLRLLTWRRSGPVTDSEIQVWNLPDCIPSGPQIRFKPVTMATLSPDAQLVLSLRGDERMDLWTVSNGEQTGQSMEHRGAVQGAEFSHDGQRILSWTFGKHCEVRQWDTTGKAIGAPMKHDGIIRGATYSKDRRHILSWSDDKTARLWSAQNGQLISAVYHRGAVLSACFSNNETRIVTCSPDGTIGLWDISFDISMSAAESLVEFEVRSATTLELDGTIRVLSEGELASKRSGLDILRRSHSENSRLSQPVERDQRPDRRDRLSGQ